MVVVVVVITDYPRPSFSLDGFPKKKFIGAEKATPSKSLLFDVGYRKLAPHCPMKPTKLTWLAVSHQAARRFTKIQIAAHDHDRSDGHHHFDSRTAAAIKPEPDKIRDVII